MREKCRARGEGGKGGEVRWDGTERFEAGRARRTEGKEKRGAGCGGRRCLLYYVTWDVLSWFCLLDDVSALLSVVLNRIVGIENVLLEM